MTQDGKKGEGGSTDFSGPRHVNVSLITEVSTMDREPKITGPVARLITVKDLERSTAFYRDVLGFQVKEQPAGAEATLGPASIRLAKEGHGSGGRAIIFLQAEDVAGKRSAILNRGGAASEIEKSELDQDAHV